MKKKINFLGICITGTIFLAFMLTTSCKKSDNGGSNNNGKTDPSTIASDNLVAYFAFENNGNDAIGGLTPIQSPNVTYVAGERGMAYQGHATTPGAADSSYFLYNLPSGSKLKDLKAFTVAMWAYIPPAINGVAPVPGIFEISGTDVTWGNMLLTQDRMDDGIDSLNIKIQFHKDGVPWNNQFVGFSNSAFIKNKWMHIVFDYDNVTSKYMIYINGAPLTLDAGITDRWAAGEDVSPRPPLGDLAFTDATQFSIGGWIQKINGDLSNSWQGFFGGKIDELRIYDKGLSATEVKDLYDAEVSQLTL